MPKLLQNKQCSLDVQPAATRRACLGFAGAHLDRSAEECNNRSQTLSSEYRIREIEQRKQSLPPIKKVNQPL
ncbi:Hypothetical predicted protein [Cloeon dipterum]|uniref:Uncharacterized protein n=1 Tax=Cloeon dipterum TaxID=197152 RepID=A0A8S1D130_9INSE|nr:Hypothetical predicted protein [Cloeon dipterum]